MLITNNIPEVTYPMFTIYTILIFDFSYIQGVSGGIVNILGGGSMEYSE